MAPRRRSLRSSMAFGLDLLGHPLAEVGASAEERLLEDGDVALAPCPAFLLLPFVCRLVVARRLYDLRMSSALSFPQAWGQAG